MEDIGHFQAQVSLTPEEEPTAHNKQEVGGPHSRSGYTDEELDTMRLCRVSNGDSSPAQPVA